MGGHGALCLDMWEVVCMQEFDYARLRESRDHGLIARVIASDDGNAQGYIAQNPHLSDSEKLELAKVGGVEAQGSLALRSDVSVEVLAVLAAADSVRVRTLALKNPLSPFADFRDAVLNGRLSSTSKSLLCWSSHAVESYEVFERLWVSVKGAQAPLIHTLDMAVWAKGLIDEDVFALVHDTIWQGDAPKDVRAEYADSSYIALPKVLDTLKDDPYRPVINHLAGNRAAWSSTHEYLIGKHKSPGIRTSVAMVTGDNALLNKIYNSTKSEGIRKAVEDNPVFVLL